MGCNVKGKGNSNTAKGKSDKKKGTGVAATAAGSGKGRNGKPGPTKDEGMMAFGKLAKTMDQFVSVFKAKGFDKESQRKGLCTCSACNYAQTIP